MCPLASSPAVTSRTASGRLGEYANSSARDHCTSTGRRACLDRTAASTATSGALLRPYVPLDIWGMTRTLSFGSPTEPATASRSPNGRWVPAYTVAPSGRTSTTAALGPIEALAIDGSVYVA